MKLKRNLFSAPLCFVINMVLVYVVYEICRLVFLATNWSVFSEAMTWGAFGEMLHGGWYFDTSAILYTNALYALLMLFPIHYKERNWYQKMAKWVFVICNSICIIANLVDCVYLNTPRAVPRLPCSLSLETRRIWVESLVLRFSTIGIWC